MVLIKFYAARAAVITVFKKTPSQTKLLIMDGQEAENISDKWNYVQVFFARLIFPIKYNKMSNYFLLYITPNLSTWNFIFIIEFG